MRLVVFCCFCLILWMFILRLLIEMGQFGNGSLISLRRGLPFGHWVFLGMMFPCTQGCFPFPSGLPHGTRRARPWTPLQRKGTREDGLSPKSPRRLPAQPVHLSLHVSLTMDLEPLDSFHQAHFNHYGRPFLSEALCFAREQPEVEGKVKLKSVLFHSNVCYLTFSQLFRFFSSNFPVFLSCTHKNQLECLSRNPEPHRTV